MHSFPAHHKTTHTCYLTVPVVQDLGTAYLHPLCEVLLYCSQGLEQVFWEPEGSSLKNILLESHPPSFRGCGGIDLWSLWKP